MAWVGDPVYEYRNNPHYIKFTQQKEEIKKKYPPQIFDLTPTSGRTSKYIDEYNKNYVKNERSLHQEYLREVADLIFKPDGEFQHLTWEIIGEKEKLEMERRARGRLYSSDYLGE